MRRTCITTDGQLGPTPQWDRLTRRDTDRLAERQRHRVGMWSYSDGRVGQHCPMCGQTVASARSIDFDEFDEPGEWAAAAEEALDEAVHDHLTVDPCPARECAP